VTFTDDIALPLQKGSDLYLVFGKKNLKDKKSAVKRKAKKERQR